ncbi:MAG: hypothetical protein ABFD89_20550 [Bryobacteraceae bacterium]
MALVYVDRVKESTTTTGTGAYTLAGAQTGFQAFSAVGDGNTCYYAITDGTNWEVGLGTYTLSGTTLARTSVLASSNGGSAVNWSAGSKTIWLDLPALFFTGLVTSASAFSPTANDGKALGTTSLSWADLYLASGGVLNWNNGNYTLTHSSGLLTASGALSLGTSNAFTTGTIELGAATDTTLSRSAAGRLAVEGQDVLLASVADQSITGGANVTTLDLGNLSGNTITPDPGDRPIQKITNNGAGTIAPGTNQGAYLLVVKNTTGAAAITTSGWTKVAGDAFGTATTAEYLCHCTVVADFSCMIIQKVTA